MTCRPVTSSRRALALLISCGVLALGGCASTGDNTAGTTPAAVESARRIGFLSDYDKLRLVAGTDATVCWRDPSVDWRRYDKVLIERIEVSLKPGGKQKTVDPTDLKALTDYYHAALVKSLAPDLQSVTVAGPGVLRVRIAITDLVPTDAAASLIGTAVPYGFVGEIAAGAASGRPAGSTPYLGETGMQAQVRDGPTGRVIGECADSSVGRKYVAELDKGVPNAAEKWATGYFDSFSSWSYARQAFDDWSKFFAARLQALRAG
jgi:hypothetical protein